MRNFILSLFACLLSLVAYGQSAAVVDSLRQVLKADISDERRVDIHNRIAYIMDWDSVLVAEQSQKAIDLSKQINYFEGLSSAYFNIAYTTGIKGDYPKAIELYHKVLAIAQEASYKGGEAKAYDGIGNIYYYQSNYPKALEYYVQSVKIFEEIGDENNMASSYTNMGNIYLNQGNYPKALEHYFKALEVFERMGKKRNMSSNYNNIGNIYYYQGDYPEALEYYRKSLKIKEEIGDEAGMANGYNNIGSIYKLQGDYPKALEGFLKALSIEEKIGNRAGMAGSYINIGNIYYSQKEYSKTLKYYRKSLGLYEEIGDKVGEASALLGLGEVYRLQKQYQKALPYLQEALAIANEVGLLDRIRVASETLSETYSALGNYRLAYQNHLIFKQMADSLNNEEITKKITQQSMQFQFEKEKAVAKVAREKEELLQRQKLQRQQYLSYALAGAFALISLVTLLIYRNYRAKQRANQLLAVQNEEIKQQSEEIFAQRDALEEQKDALEASYQQSEKLLLNILPAQTAQELKETGKATPKAYEKASVLFTDFKGFTNIVEKMSEEEVVSNLDYCFKNFDRIIKKHGLEKIKTIGDAYMCAGGIPTANDSNPVDAVKAAQEIIAFMCRWKEDKNAKNEEAWEVRIGIHTGKVVAGVVGEDKFAYDIWGDAVNIASRMESSGEPGKINISGDTYALVKEHFQCEYRGKVQAKNKGEVDMYFVGG